jgi:hypothetical protein
MKHLAGVKLSKEQHQRLVEICDSPSVFPSNYEGWLQLVQAGEAEAALLGQAVQPLEIEVDDLVAWCRMVGIVPCIDAMKAYAIVQRLGPTELAFPAAPSKARRNGNGRAA